MALLHVKDSVYVKIKIEGQDLSPSTHLIDSINLTEGVNQVLPTLQIRLKDSIGELNRKYSLVDSTIISIDLAKDPSKGVYSGTYRLFGIEQEEYNDGPITVITALLDYPKYTHRSWSVKNGDPEDMKTSDQTMALIQGLSEFPVYIGWPTNDLQVWLNPGKTLKGWAEEVCTHGWVHDKSCMAYVVLFGGVFMYQDINALICGGPKITFFHNVDGDPKVRQARVIGVSGLFNQWINYGYQYTQPGLDGGHTLHSKVDVPKSGPWLPINAPMVAPIVVVSRLEYAKTLGFGWEKDLPGNNVHENYIKAWYQNIRFSSIYTERIQILIEDQINRINPLDCVEYQEQNYINGKFETNARNSGKYLVTTKTVYVKGGSNYYERYDLARNHVTERGQTPLM